MKIIIYGANEVGSLIATEFFEDHDIIVIDPDFSKLEKFSRLDISTISGDASNVNVLKEIDVKNCDVFIGCAMLDEANIVGCLMAKQLSPKIKTVCFVSKKETMDSLRSIREDVPRENNENHIHIDHVIWPEKLLTQEIFRTVTVPEAIDVENFAQGRAKLMEYRIKENSLLANKAVKNCDFPEDCLVVGLVREEELFIPLGDTVLKPFDKAIFMGTSEGLDVCASKFFSEVNRIKLATIIGGGSVGYELAKSLEKTSIKIKIIECDMQRCEFLSENLKKTLVLHADATNLELLNQENVSDSDFVVGVTDSDEKNLLVSLLVKQSGVKKVVARASQAITASLFEKVGIDVAVSPKEAAVNEIKNRIIESQIGILATVERGLGEILEIVVPESFHDTLLMDLKLPARGIIAIIQRASKVLIPKGKTLVRSDDKLIIFTKAQDAQAIRDYFKR